MLCGFGQQWCDADAAGEEVVHQASLELSQLGGLGRRVLYAVIDFIQARGNQILFGTKRLCRHQTPDRWQVQARFCARIVQFADVGLCNWPGQVMANESRIKSIKVWAYQCNVLVDVRLAQTIWNDADDTQIGRNGNQDVARL